MSTGTKPDVGGPALIDRDYILGLAAGKNREAISGLVAHAGGTKAAALQIVDTVAIASFGTTATNGDSALLPAAKKGNTLFVENRGAATLSLYGKGTDTVNASATATAYDITTGKCATFFCPVDGHWGAILTA